jgi:hypothetical protein
MLIKRVKFSVRLVALAVLFWMFCLLILNPSNAQAEYVVYDGKVDNYHVTVWASPNPISVGKVKLLLRLGRQVNVSQEYPVRDAQVTVQFRQLTGPGTQPGSTIDTYHKALAANETEPGNYEMEDSLLSEGRYQTIINMDSGVGKSNLTFEFTAQPQPDDRIVSLLLLALFPLGLLLLVYFYVRRPKSASNQSSNQAEGIGAVDAEVKVTQSEEISSR